MLAQKIIELNLATRKIARKDGNGKALNQKIRLLFLLSKGDCSPKHLIPELSIAKPNLTILARQMIKDGLIEKLPYSDDKRAVIYHITQKGLDIFNDALSDLEHEFLDAFSEQELEGLNKKLDEVLKALNLMI